MWLVKTHTGILLTVSVIFAHDAYAGPVTAKMGRTQEDASIGIIGMGDMGKMYAQRLSDAGWR